MMLRNTRVGSVALNTSADAVFTNALSIQPIFRSPRPIKTMANTGSVVSMVCRNRSIRVIKGGRWVEGSEEIQSDYKRGES